MTHVPPQPQAPAVLDAGTPAPARPRSRWLGRQAPRVGLSMFLSVLLHLAVAALVALLLLLAARPDIFEPSGDVSVHLVNPPGPATPPVPGGPAGPGQQGGPSPPTPPATPAGGERVTDPTKPVAEDTAAAAADATRKIGKTADRKVAENTAKDKDETARKARATLDKQRADIAKELAANQAQLDQAKKSVADAIDQVARSPERRRKWARWILWASLPGIQAADGKLVVFDHPGKGQYTYVTDVASDPRRTTGKRPDSFTFQPLDDRALAMFVLACRRAGLDMKPGSYVPCVVYPGSFEATLTRIERQEMARRGVTDPWTVLNTTFLLSDEGKVTLQSMTVKTSELPPSPPQSPKDP